jgi:hypothetical protein
MITIWTGGWIFLGACFLAIHRVYPFGKSAGLASLFVVSMILYECGHAIAARYYHASVHEIGLCVWGDISSTTNLQIRFTTR